MGLVVSSLSSVDSALTDFACIGPSETPAEVSHYDPEWSVRALIHDRERWFAEGLQWLENDGSTVVFCGPMASSKSLEALSIGDVFEEFGFTVAYAKPSVDKRSPTVHSRSGTSSSTCLSLDMTEESLLLQPDVLVIDEAQFGKGNRLARLIYARRKLGKRTVIAMLDEDFRGEQWGCYEILKENGERLNIKFIQTHALCACCGSKATKTQRLVDGEPARYDDPLVVIGADEQYEPRCIRHHVVPGATIEP